MHFAGISDDPCRMWTKLEKIHLQKRSRFNAYDALFSIRKLPDESLQALMARVDQGMQNIKELRPDDFTLDKMDNEIVCMTLLRALHGVLLFCIFSADARQVQQGEAPGRPKNSSGTAPTTGRRTLVRSLLQHLSSALPATSLATSVRSQVILSPPVIATALLSSRQLRTRRRAQERRKFRPRGGKSKANAASGQACYCCLCSAGIRWYSKSSFQLDLYSFSARC